MFMSKLLAILDFLSELPGCPHSFETVPLTMFVKSLYHATNNASRRFSRSGNLFPTWYPQRRSTLVSSRLSPGGAITTSMVQEHLNGSSWYANTAYTPQANETIEMTGICSQRRVLKAKLQALHAFLIWYHLESSGRLRKHLAQLAVRYGCAYGRTSIIHLPHLQRNGFISKTPSYDCPSFRSSQ